MKKSLQFDFVMAKANSIYNGIMDITVILAAAILIFVMLSVCSEIVLRYFFDSPIIWVIEISEYSLLFITFLGSGWVLKGGHHVSIDIVSRTIKGKTAACLGMVRSVVGVVVSCVFIRYGGSVSWEYFLSGSFRPTSLDIPTFLILWIIPFGSFFLLVEFLKEFYKNLKVWH